MLTIHDHSRDRAGLTYVYPVVSRRAGGVSIGINLNPNNACNWACIYCQVEGLVRGGPPPIDLTVLRSELSGFLADVLHGDFMATEVPSESRVLKDIAFSGNGEPTAAAEFEMAVREVLAVLAEFKLSKQLPVRLITNGSLLHRETVQRGIAQLGAAAGEVWFKVDRVTGNGVREVNGVPLEMDSLKNRLNYCLALAPTWIQTCWFALDGLAPSFLDENAYIEFLLPFADRLAGVHLYGVARPGMQAGSGRVAALTEVQMTAFAERVQKETGLKVHLAR